MSIIRITASAIVIIPLNAFFEYPFQEVPA